MPTGAIKCSPNYPPVFVPTASAADYSLSGLGVDVVLLWWNEWR